MTLLNVIVAAVAVLVMLCLVVALGFRFDRGNVGLLAVGAVAIVVVLKVLPLH